MSSIIDLTDSCNSDIPGVYTIDLTNVVESSPEPEPIEIQLVPPPLPVALVEYAKQRRCRSKDQN